MTFSVFALGNSSYLNFCGFGKEIDNLLNELDGKRLLQVGLGDELSGQEDSFNLWSAEVFKVSRVQMMVI